jgi:replicative superfamily II helicase/uncharacterized tellurite resistance protein B-like protein
MERLINHENVYHNIKNLLENEADVDAIVKRLIQYHFVLKNPKIETIKEQYSNVFAEAISVYSKIAFYLLTRLNSFKYDAAIERSGFEMAAFCFEIIAKNGDLSDVEIEESKLLSSICYTLAGNAANSIVMARSIETDSLELYKLFFERNFKKILNIENNPEDRILTAIKKMAYSLIYKSDFEIEDAWNEETLHILKNMESEEVYYFRLVTLAYKRMCDNSIRKLTISYPLLTKYINVLTQKEKIYELWEAQKSVSNRMQEVLDNNKVSYISLPTSAGKTLLAELILYNYISINSRLQFYIVPSLALENEVRIKLGRRFRKVGVKVTNSVEVDDEGKVLLPQIVVATPEKIDNYLRRNTECFELIDCIIIDEFHKVSAGLRGWYEEVLAVWLNYKRREYKYKIVLISAIANNVDETLNMDIANVFEDSWSPTRKQYCQFKMRPDAPSTNRIKKGQVIEQYYDLIMKYQWDDNQVFKINKVFAQVTYGKKRVDGKDSKKSDTKADVAWKAVLCIRESPLMVFFFSKKEQERFVKKAELYMEDSIEGAKISANLAQILGEEHLLVKSLKYGVAYHNGDLPDDVRNIIENEFRKNHIKIIACTTTLADGVNLPAKAILMANMFIRISDTHYRNLDKSDYKNIVGRIGRALCDTEGVIYLINYPEYRYAEQDYQAYYNGISISCMLNSELDYPLELQDDDELRNQDEEAYKAMIYLQLLIFTLSIDFDNFDNLYQELKSSQLMKMTENKKNTLQKYGRRYFNLAKNIDSDYLTKSIKTGVSYKTNIVLKEIADDIIDSNNVEDVISESIYLSLLSCIEFDPQNNNPNHYDIFIAWIQEDSLSNIADIISGDSKKDKYEIAAKYIKKVFQYIAPWMFGCLSEYLEEKIEAKKVVDKLRNQVRYGTQDDDVIALCNRGIKSRDLAISVAKVYHESDSTQNVIDWLIGIKDRVLYEKLVDLYDVSILEQVGSVRRENKDKSSYFEKADRIKVRLFLFETENIREIQYDMETSFLYLKHIKDNPFNEFRVDLICGNRNIGYLPDVVSEEICEILDADEILRCEYAEADEDKIWIYISKKSIVV